MRNLAILLISLFVSAIASASTVDNVVAALQAQQMRCQTPETSFSIRPFAFRAGSSGSGYSCTLFAEFAHMECMDERTGAFASIDLNAFYASSGTWVANGLVLVTEDIFGFQDEQTMVCRIPMR